MGIRHSHGCLRCCLYGLNFMYLILALIIITLPVYFKVNALLKSWPINGGIIAAGVFLLIVAIAGIYGSWRQHQIILFFYMVILVILFILLFAFSLAALGITKHQQRDVLITGWSNSQSSTKESIQFHLDCCGFEDKNITSGGLGHPSCKKVPCCRHTIDKVLCPKCPTCLNVLERRSFRKFRQATGGFALFFSFSMFLGVYLAFKFRHLRNPRANPDQFL